MIAVRRATPDDASAVASIHIRAWQAAYARVFPGEALAELASSLDRRAEFWLDTIGSGSDTLVADDGDEVVGFANFGPARDDDLDSRRVAELYAIYVSPEAWGAGAGRALMAELLARLGTARFGEVVLWVLDDNPRARRFYERAGWSLDGRVKDETFLDTRVREVRYRIALA